MLLFPHRKGLPYAKELEPGVEEAAEQVTDCSLIINKIRLNDLRGFRLSKTKLI